MKIVVLDSLSPSGEDRRRKTDICSDSVDSEKHIVLMRTKIIFCESTRRTNLDRDISCILIKHRPSRTDPPAPAQTAIVLTSILVFRRKQHLAGSRKD